MTGAPIEARHAARGTAPAAAGARPFWPRAALRALFYWLAFVLLSLSFAVNRYFGEVGLNQIAYHLNFGYEGLMTADPGLIRRFQYLCLIAPLVAVALAALAEWCLACLARPGRFMAALAHRTRPLPYLLVAGALVLWMLQVSLFSAIAASFGPDVFSAQYVPPASVVLKQGKPKNLVLIYVEGLEQGYGNVAAMGSNLLAPLEWKGGLSFGQYRQVPVAGWTMGAVVASQCGIPLKRVSFHDANRQGEAFNTFLPNAVCLSDILAERGYRNVFMGGADLAFSGKRRFLQSHHYHEMYGKNEWLAQGMGAGQMHGWGMYDADLLARAKRKLAQLHAAGTPFNLTVLTVDTHEPQGFLSERCAGKGYQEFRGVVACTAADVADFVRFIETSGYLADTNVVVMGDHLSRSAPLTGTLMALPDRGIFNVFLSGAPLHKTREQLVHFDLFPTLIELAGFEVTGGRLGLGYSGFNDARPPPPDAREQQLDRAVRNYSPAYMALWGELR